MQMQSMTVTDTTAQRLRGSLPAVLRGWRLWLLVGSAALAAGVAWQWHWLLAIGVLPFVVSVAPCVAMCALGLCASRLGGSSCQSSSAGGSSSTTVTPARAQSDTTETAIRN